MATSLSLSKLMLIANEKKLFLCPGPGGMPLYIDDFIGDQCSDNFKGFHSVYKIVDLWLLLLCA